MLSRPQRDTLILAILPLLFPPIAHAQTETNVQELQRIAQEAQARTAAGMNNAYYSIVNSQDPDIQAMLNEPGTKLMFVDANGDPLWYGLHDKWAAKWVRTDEVYPGGVGGYNLSGAMTTGQTLAIWDGEVPLITHQELAGKVTLRDATPVGDHGTQVMGVMIGAGILDIDPALPRGMSYAAEADAWNWDDDTAEMALAAIGGTRISNHSYGRKAGWDGSPDHWVWRGDIVLSADEDYKFGYYDEETQAWDDLAYNAPFMLIVTSAGNEFWQHNGRHERDVVHKHYTLAGYQTATDTHPYDGEVTNGYDTIPTKNGAKNVLTVGACYDYPGNYTMPSDVTHGAGSGAGPTDDGRIKPDLVASGIDLCAPTSVGTDTYDYNTTGTSVASPGVAGSANLVREHYLVRYGKEPRAATLKTLLIHTAEETGDNDGPDYFFGWGLMNTRRAVDIVNATDPYTGVGCGETVLDNGTTDYFYFESELVTDFKVTIGWTDPPGEVVAPVVDDPTPKLVNDLDLRIEYLSGTPVTHMPWVLDPVNYENAATHGDNVVDNVEQVLVAGAPPGLYRVSISHKGALVNGSQAYSLVWSGMNPTIHRTNTRGARFEMFPGLLPMPAPPFQIATGGGEERGVYITVFEDILVREVGVLSWTPCPSDFFVSIYKATRNNIDPSAGSRTSSRSSLGQPIATGMITSYTPGWDYHYIPVNVQLNACEDYYVSFQLPQTILSWPWYNEGLLKKPVDLGGAIRLREGAASQDPANGAMPLISFVAEATADANDIPSDLEAPNTPWSTCADNSYERGIIIEPKQTLRVQAVALEAAIAGSARFTAKIYDAPGGVRGALIAEGSDTIDDSPLQMQEVPINATLFEGRQYDVVMEFPPNTWSCFSDAALPVTVDDAITILDGEYMGNTANSLMPHMTLTWRDGAGGNTFDLGKQSDVFPPPFTETSSINHYGIYVISNGDHELYSLGWFADVPAGKTITIRVYSASGEVRGSLLAEGSIASTADGARWHDVPVSASLFDGVEYDFDVEMEDVNEFGYWDDSTGLPYEPYGAFTVVTGESWGDGSDHTLIWMRANACDETATPVAQRPAPTFAMRTPYPNPTASTAIIDYSLDEAGPVTVTVYDVRGRRVSTPLVRASRPAGPGSIVIDTRELPQGIYFVKLNAGLKSATRKMSILR